MSLRAGGFSALIVVGMTVLGVAVLYATFYVFLNVDGDGPHTLKMTECEFTLQALFFVRIIEITLVFSSSGSGRGLG